MIGQAGMYCNAGDTVRRFVHRADPKMSYSVDDDDNG